MKKFLFLFAVLIGLFILPSCGEKGQDGRAYLSFTWDWYVDSYTDNNGSTPSNFYSYTNYQTSPGSYNYSYDCSDGAGSYWGYYGYYTITVQPGEEPSGFADGEDGSDNYFRLDLSGYGSDFYLLKPSKELKTSLNDIQREGKRVDIGNEEIIILRGPSATMVITKQKFIIQ